MHVLYNVVLARGTMGKERA